MTEEPKRITETLERLADQYRRGILTSEEYAEAKRAVIGIDKPKDGGTIDLRPPALRVPTQQYRPDRDRQVTVRLIGGVVAIMAVVGMLLWLNKGSPIGSTSTQTAGATTSSTSFRTSPTTEPQSSQSEAIGMRTFDGSHFSLHYPIEWSVQLAEGNDDPAAPERQTTRISAGAAAERAIRVDFSPGACPSGAQECAARAHDQLAGNSRYAEEVAYYPFELELGGSTYDAVYWEYLSAHPDSGVMLHSVNVHFVDGADGFALLTRVPESEYESWAPTLDRVRSSLRVK